MNRKIKLLSVAFTFLANPFCGNKSNITSFDNVFNNIRRANYTQKATSIDENTANSYVSDSKGRQTIEIRKGNYIFTRYEIVSSRTFASSYYVGLSVVHDPAIASTSISISSFTSITIGYTAGFGATAKTGAFGLSTEMELEMSNYNSNSETFAAGVTLGLDSNSKNNPKEAGTYYVYLNAYYSDVVNIEKSTDGTFISAEYVKKSSSRDSSFVLSLTKPQEFNPVPPKC
jgi:hypothetical protein